MDKKTIGVFIAVLRKSKGLTQKELGDMLGVSDKAVSRWERDETAPDISLIPVIADLFDVTADELLRGEKSADQAENAFMQKSEIRIRYMIGKALSKIRIMSIISFGTALFGMIGAAICNYAFIRSYLAFGLGLLFDISAIIMEIIFALHVLSGINTDEELFNEKLIPVKISVFGTSYCTAAVIFSFILSLLPLLFSGNAYFGITADTWVPYGILCLTAGLLLALPVYIFAKIHIIKKEYKFTDTPGGKKALSNARLAEKMTALALCVALVTGIAQVNVSALDMRYFTSGIIFTDIDEFKNFMAQSSAYSSVEASTLPTITQATEQSTATNIYDAGDDPIDEYTMDQFLDKDGNVLFSFAFRNSDVIRMDTDEADSENFKVRVYTGAHSSYVTHIKTVITFLSPVVYIIEALVFFLQYRKKRII